MIEFKDKFTCDGLVRVPRGVTVEDVRRVEALITDAKRGSRVSEATLVEAITSGELAAATGHFLNVITIPQLPDVTERPVSAIAGSRVVNDFRPAVLYSAFGSVTGAGIESDGAAARIPEGTPYPIVTISGVESAYSKLAKRGFRFDWTFEAMVNDPIGYLDQIPSEVAQITLDTEWAEVGEALTSATTNTTAQTLPDGTTSVTVNAAVSPNAILAAIQQMSQVTVNGTGRKVGTLSGYTVVVPVGKKLALDWAIRQAQNIVSIVPAAATGGAVYGAPLDNGVFQTINVVEHEAVTGTNWYILPKPGAYRRPVIDLLRLRNYETPQVRYRGSADGDEFSFDADTAAFRYRYVTGAALWFNEVVLHSEGDGN